MRPRTRPRLRKVYLLPNLLTAFNLFLGIYALMNIYEGDLRRACWAIFLAGLMDGLDGMVARLTHTSSDFGMQFDSLSDLVSFGVAPAIVMFDLMHRLGQTGPRIALGVCSLYAICGALRLARYNVQAHGQEKHVFVGLPIPAGAGMMIFSALAVLEYLADIQTMVVRLWPASATVDLLALVTSALPLMILCTALLMVSEVPYISPLRYIKLRRQMSFYSLVSMIFIVVVILALQSDMRVALLFAMMLLYVAFGLGRYLFKVLTGRSRTVEPAGSQAPPTGSV